MFVNAYLCMYVFECITECVCIFHTQFIEATITKLLSAEAQLFQVHAFEAMRTLVTFSVRGTMGVWDGQAVPCHITDQKKEKKNVIKLYVCNE